MSIRALVRREHVLAELPQLGYCWTGEVQMHCISPTAQELKTPAQCAVMEKEALEVAQEMKAEYWAVSSLTGENVRDFFCVAALIFEANVLAELEKSGAQRTGDVIRINSDDSNLCVTARKKQPTCCP